MAALPVTGDAITTIQYTPPPTVRDFIRHYTPGELFLDWIVGPVGSGKTTGIFFKLIYMAGLQAKSPIDGIRRSRCVVVRNTAPQLKDTTIKSFDYWFKDGTAGKWYATDKNFVLRYADVECEVMFRPLDTPDDVARVLSLEVTFAIIDEFVQLPQAIIEALSGRCGRYPPKVDGGATNWGMWGASNPGMESDWWYPMLEDNTLLPADQAVPSNWKYFKQPSGFADGSTKYGGLKAENQINLAPYTEDNAYYTNLAKGKTQHWIKQFIEVEWGYSMSGKPVFPMFQKEIHVAKLRSNPALQLAIGYDPGLSGSAFILGQYDDSVGRLAVLAEVVMEDYATDRAITEKLKPLLRSRFPDHEVIIIPDPASANRSQGQTGSSVMMELKKHFAVKEDTDNTLESRLQPAQYYMMRLTAEGPALIIDPSCIRLIRALVSGYKYSLVKTQGDTKREAPDKNIHSHPADAFTYLARYYRKGEERAGRRLGQNAQPRRLQSPRLRNPYVQR
jgi:hypothetical protein